jgi:phosphoribosylformylglycinamidine cyclo-ligase
MKVTTYKQAGVDIDAGNRLVRIIKKIAPSVGGFSGFYPLKKTNYYLAASSDGVGTKLKLAFMLNKHDTVGIDLVAMNVNDIICSGAKPIFFLDYFACGRLKLNTSAGVIKGISKGCNQAGCILLGGETAEMPGFYRKGEYDLAGFAVGVIERNRVIDGSKIKPGNVVIGLPSSGLHSNGFSLVHKIFSKKGLKRYGKVLLQPTKIYVREILRALSASGQIKGIAHITGGGFYDNIRRILPKNCRVVIKKYKPDGTPVWKIHEIFRIIQKKGNISEKEMYRVFNMGIGMVLVADRSVGVRLQKLLKGSKIIGEVTSGNKEVKII